MTKQQQSPAVKLIQLAWDYSCSGVSHSWQVYNHAVADAARLAAESFRWDKGDLDIVSAIHNSRRGIDISLGEHGYERLYTVAVKSGNMTFCEEYERWRGREPIIADGANRRQRDRLCVGSQFEWQGEIVTVTSFAKDGAAVACSYHPAKSTATDEEFGVWLKRADIIVTNQTDQGARSLRAICDRDYRGSPRLIAKRFRITREAVVADRTVRNARQDIWDALGEVSERSMEDSEAVTAALRNIGIANRSDFNRAKIATLQKVLASVTKPEQVAGEE